MKFFYKLPTTKNRINTYLSKVGKLVICNQNENRDLIEKKIIIFTENNVNSGRGHFSRMKGLYLFLKKKKINCRLILFTKDKLKIIEKFNPEVVIFDLNSYKNFKIDKILNSKKLKVITIENFDNSKYDLNLSVFDHNQNLNSRRVKGLKYAMIRPEIIKSKTKIEKKN